MKVFTDTTRLNQLINQINPNSEAFIKAIGFQIEALAKMKAPIDTGALRNSIYTRTSNNNQVPQESTEELPKPSTEFSVVVGPSVEYAIYQELGTSVMQAQPFMLPALREVERQLEQHARILIDE